MHPEPVCAFQIEKWVAASKPGRSIGIYPMGYVVAEGTVCSSYLEPTVHFTYLPTSPTSQQVRSWSCADTVNGP